MTIQVNEFHVFSSVRDTKLVHVADRRLTIAGKFKSNTIKNFEIPYLRASVGYFGLAQPSPTVDETFSAWLPNVIKHGFGIKTISDFADYLTDELNRKVCKSLLRKHASGFHVAGYGPDEIPEFHYVRNVGGMNGPFYIDLQDKYVHTEDFRTRDAIHNEDGSSRSIESLANCVFYYANGDLSVFGSYWTALDQMIDMAQSHSNFKGLDSPLDRAVWKLETFGSFYGRFARAKIISKQVDAIEFNSSQPQSIVERINVQV